ncbi:NAD(P)-binding domain protein [Ophiocordyceps camponoti-floridani]|uniref:NAD(P)-binding domain protein n=1 Tax=Ophiocordyceps camponoti-floridani TaxID=2030778 RepID=A0A8H4VG77_9HYPO|nr:NAD(P)-binding domain protein [Ophiocordyceps camponoti-floridani]
MTDRKIVLITGANTGLGFEMVRALCGSDKAYEMLVGGRSLDKANKAVEAAVGEFPSSKSRVSAIQVDIEDDESIQRAFEDVKGRFGRVDALINNAGATFDQHIHSGDMTMRQAWNQSWNVNTTGSQVMTHVFVPLLLQSSDPRLLFITSGTATLTGSENRELVMNKLCSKGWPKTPTGSDPRQLISSYRSAKTGLNMMMREWHRILSEDGVKVWGISPGYLATGLGGSLELNKQRGAGDASLGGEFVREVLEGRRDGDVGKAIQREGRVQPW